MRPVLLHLLGLLLRLMSGLADLPGEYICSWSCSLLNAVRPLHIWIFPFCFDIAPMVCFNGDFSKTIGLTAETWRNCFDSIPGDEYGRKEGPSTFTRNSQSENQAQAPLFDFYFIASLETAGIGVGLTGVCGHPGVLNRFWKDITGTIIFLWPPALFSAHFVIVRCNHMDLKRQFPAKNQPSILQRTPWTPIASVPCAFIFATSSCTWGSMISSFVINDCL